jgi:hypothetical protein
LERRFFDPKEGSGRLLNVQGQQVSQFTLSGASTLLLINRLPVGTYFIEIQLDENPAMRKRIIINR